MMASDRALLFLMLWFMGLGVGCFAYLRDFRGTLSRVVEQRFIVAQHAELEPSRDRTRWRSPAPDRTQIRRQQRVAAGYGIAMSVAVVLFGAATLTARVA